MPMLETASKDPPSRKEWRSELEARGAQEGFYREIGNEHSALHVKRGATLIVTFENLDDVFNRGDKRLPWGHRFVEANGWSMLGLMAHDWTWYRDEAVYDFFDELKQTGFFDGFEHVVFYGASMGGYAAAAFSSAAPGATNVLISPQATLSREVAPWETRYHRVWRRNFSGPYGYAPDLIGSSRHTYIFYDPCEPLDAMHAALFAGENVSKYRCRHFGHRIASSWLRMGILKPIVQDCISGSMNAPSFYTYLRNRRDDMKYQRNMLAKLQDEGKPNRVAMFCEAILARRGAPRFRKALRAARAELDR